MCGSLQMTWKEKMSVAAGKLLSSKAIYPHPKRDLPFSSHRFIRSEKMNWWKKQNLSMIDVCIEALSFAEKGTWIPIPEGYVIDARVHRSLPGFFDQDGQARWVISIVTVNPRSVIDLDLIETARAAGRVHHRMPRLLERRAS